MPRNLTYREIADDITERIHRGDEGHQPDDQLPSYAELARLYSVSVSTAARAVGLLHDRGLVESIVGRGIYVSKLRNHR
jgi:GntR family transcriptional regulator